MLVISLNGNDLMSSRETYFRHATYIARLSGPKYDPNTLEVQTRFYLLISDYRGKERIILLLGQRQ